MNKQTTPEMNGIPSQPNPHKPSNPNNNITTTTSRLTQVLQDPTAQWSDIREALKSQGRGSFFVGKNGTLRSTTNASIIKALRESSLPISAKSANVTTAADVTSASVVTAAGKNNLERISSSSSNQDKSPCSAVADDQEKCCKAEKDDAAKDKGSAFPTENLTARDNIDYVSKSFIRPKERKKTGEEKAALTVKDAIEIRRSLPPRRLPLSRSKTGLKNVMEDVEVTNMNDLDNSELKDDDRNNGDDHFAGSLGGILPKKQRRRATVGCRQPMYPPGSFRNNTTEDSLPARRLPRKGSVKGATWRGSLHNVVEDKEADDLEEEQSAHSVHNSNKSLHLFHSDTTKSSTNSNQYKESINIMDFGVSQRPFTESMLSLDASSTKSPATMTADDDMSNLVDSKGFLGWDNDSSSDSAFIRDAYRSKSKRMDSDGFIGWGNDSSSDSTSIRDDQRPKSKSGRAMADSLDTNSSGIYNLVDSMGFLDWGEKQAGEDESFRNLMTNTSDDDSNDGDASIDDGGNDVPKKSTATVEDDVDGESKGDCKSWRIEDYEDPNDMIDPSKRPKRSTSIGNNLLSKQIKRLSGKVVEISLKRNSWNVNADQQTAKGEIRIHDIKQILLNSRSTSTSVVSDGNNAKDDSAAAADGPLKSIFGNRTTRRWSSDAFPGMDPNPNEDNEYYSRPAIRINREDDIDIGEMRKELCRAAAKNLESNHTSKGRLNMGFF